MNRTARIVNIDVADIRQRTINGMPLTRDEQRWLVELTGDPLPLNHYRKENGRNDAGQTVR